MTHGQHSFLKQVTGKYTKPKCLFAKIAEVLHGPYCCSTFDEFQNQKAAPLPHLQVFHENRDISQVKIVNVWTCDLELVLHSNHAPWKRDDMGCIPLVPLGTFCRYRGRCILSMTQEAALKWLKKMQG